METLEIAEVLGSAAAVVIVVFMFLKSLRTRDENLITQSQSRDERMIKVIDRNSMSLDNSTQMTGSMLEVLRRMERNSK